MYRDKYLKYKKKYLDLKVKMYGSAMKKQQKKQQKGPVVPGQGAGPAVLGQVQGPDIIKVISYNVSHEAMGAKGAPLNATECGSIDVTSVGANPSVPKYNMCRKNIINLICDSVFDFLGIQEGGPGLFAQIIAKLNTKPGNQFNYVINTIGSVTAGIIYNENKFTVGPHHSGQIFDVRGQPNGRPYISCVFNDNINKKNYYVISAHFPHGLKINGYINEIGKIFNDSQIVIDTITGNMLSINPRHNKIILMGDFNDSGGIFSDITINNTLLHGHNINTYGNPSIIKDTTTVTRPFDKILASNKMIPPQIRHESLHTAGNIVLPPGFVVSNIMSDHLPIASTITF